MKSEMQLLRLKEALGVRKDGEVAAALGMSKAAFSQRKNAGTIPTDKLLELRRTRRDIDVVYVLTGVRWEIAAKTGGTDVLDAAIRMGYRELEPAGARALDIFEGAIEEARHDPQVRELLAILIWCSRERIRDIKLFASQLMGDRPVPFSKREPADEFLIGPMPTPPSEAEPKANESAPTPTPKAAPAKQGKARTPKP